jgi:hypothetical protein
VSTGTGVDISKANIYAAVAPSDGVNITKANIYAVTAPPSLSISKGLVYAVIIAGVATVARPVVQCCG